MQKTQNSVTQRFPGVERLRAGLPEFPPPLAKPALVVVSGLPGAGKSYFSRSLVRQLPLLVLESDRLRKTLYPNPTYAKDESATLFRACHELIRDLLGQGVSILLDATNLVEAHREPLYYIANRLDAKLVLVHIQAAPEVIRQRLAARTRGADPEDSSSAGWEVYQQMQPTVEPIGRDHFVVDTTGDISPAISVVVREIRRYVSA